MVALNKQKCALFLFIFLIGIVGIDINGPLTMDKNGLYWEFKESEIPKNFFVVVKPVSLGLHGNIIYSLWVIFFFINALFGPEVLACQSITPLA